MAGSRIGGAYLALVTALALAGCDNPEREAERAADAEAAVEIA